jgi:hypothetical protein
MITSLIYERHNYELDVLVWPWGKTERTYATYYKGDITQGSTASESINRMLEKLYVKT